MATSVTEIAPQNLRLSKHTDMTIHWKGLEGHFLMVPLVFQFNHFRGKDSFSEFFSQKPVLKEQRNNLCKKIG
jgi:hypothetical protein